MPKQKSPLTSAERSRRYRAKLNQMRNRPGDEAPLPPSMRKAEVAKRRRLHRRRKVEIEGVEDRARYMADDRYAELVAALLDHRFNPDHPESAVKMALGDLANLWPDSIRADAERYNK